jgi:hypothetical protein
MNVIQRWGRIHLSLAPTTTPLRLSWGARSRRRPMTLRQGMTEQATSSMNFPRHREGDLDGPSVSSRIHLDFVRLGSAVGAPPVTFAI